MERGDFEGCGFAEKSRVWGKADLFALFIELDQQLKILNNPVRPIAVLENLGALYGAINAGKIESQGVEGIRAEMLEEKGRKAGWHTRIARHFAVIGGLRREGCGSSDRLRLEYRLTHPANFASISRAFLGQANEC